MKTSSSDVVQEEKCFMLTLHAELSQPEFGDHSDSEWTARLEERLAEAVSANGVGEFEGNEFGEGWFKLFAVGTDPEVLTKIAMQVISEAELARPCYFTLADQNSSNPPKVVWINAVPTAGDKSCAS